MRLKTNSFFAFTTTVCMFYSNIANNPMEIYLNTKGKPRSRCPQPQLPTTSYHNNHHHHHQSSREIVWHQIREDYIHDSHIAGSKKLSFGLRRYVMLFIHFFYYMTYRLHGRVLYTIFFLLLLCAWG